MFHDRPYRSHDGGIAKLNTDLSIDFEVSDRKLYPSNVYSVKTLRDKVYIGTTDGFLKIIDANSNEIKSISVGDFPGDIEFWYKNKYEKILITGTVAFDEIETSKGSSGKVIGVQELI